MALIFAPTMPDALGKRQPLRRRARCVKLYFGFVPDGPRRDNGQVFAENMKHVGRGRSMSLTFKPVTRQGSMVLEILHETTR